MASPHKSAPTAPLHDARETGHVVDFFQAIQDSAVGTEQYQAQAAYTQQRHESGDGLNTRPTTASVGELKLPRDAENVHDPLSSYYYERQGELILERDRRQMRSGTSIHHVNTDSNWPVGDGATSHSSDGFAVPRRPTADSSLKRKSSQDIALAASKRAMSQSGERSMEDIELMQPGHSFGGNPSSGTQRSLPTPDIQMVLPARKVFPIQIGDKLFRLSGASISSDGPSYFSQFFEEQMRLNEGAESCRTLYIDRDPATFEDISLHLQGYHVEPRDGPHFVKLFADAQFFSLPRLTALLFSSTIYICIGEQDFRIPKDLFNNPGDSPNYFSLGFSSFFSTQSDRFPGLSQGKLLRPPSLMPPSVPNRSALVFIDLLNILKGYDVQIRHEQHRTELLRDAKYYHLKGLEQRLVPHQISFNLGRQKSEILIRLEDVRTSGISFVADSTIEATTPATSPESSTTSMNARGPGWVYYQRPYVDSEAYNLIIEIGGEENTILEVEPPVAPTTARIARATFHGQTLLRITRLLSVVADKMALPVTQPLGLMMLERGGGVASLPVSPQTSGMSDEKVKVRIGSDADVIVDGQKWQSDACSDVSEAMDADDDRRTSSRRQSMRQQSAGNTHVEWVISKAQWRLRVQPVSSSVQSDRNDMEVILAAVKIEAYSNERSRNSARDFLT